MLFLFRSLMTLLHLAALALATGAALAALVAQGGIFSDRLDVLTHFAPVWLTLAMAALGLWILAGGRQPFAPTPVMAAIAILASGALIVPEFLRPSGGPPPAEGETLKIVQFNLWGRGENPDRAVKWILAQDADILVFQEAFARSGGVARALSSQYPHHVTCAEPYPCSTMILSRQRPVRKRNLGGNTPYVLSGAEATFATPKGEFSVIGVHFTWPIPAGPQQQQTLRLARVVAEHPRETTIVSGDFNSTPWSFSLRRQDQMLGLIRRTRGQNSWPATAVSRWKVRPPLPFLAIDQVYAGSDWKTVSVTRGPKLGSDHYPIVTVLRR